MKQVGFLALKNIIKKPGRSTIIAICIAIITALQVAVSIIDTSTAQTLNKGLSRLGADLMVVPKTSDASVIKAYATGTPETYYMPDISQKIRSMPFIKEVSPQLHIQSLSNASCCAIWNVFLIGFDPETDFTVQPWLKKKITKFQPNDILRGAGIQLPVGAPVEFYGQNFRVAGTLEPGSLGLDFSIFLPLEAAYKMVAESAEKAERRLDIPIGSISALMIKLKDVSQGGVPSWRAASEIRKQFPEITVIKPVDITVRVKTNLSNIMTMSTSISYVIWPMCALLIALIFTMMVRERQKEIGLLQALGATRLHIFVLIESEAFLISFFGAVTGALSSWVVTQVFSQSISTRLEIPIFSTMYTDAIHIMLKLIAFALIIGCLSALIPALKATFLEPYEAIRK